MLSATTWMVAIFCLELTNGDSIEMEFSSQAILDEYIIQYTHYKTRLERLDILQSALTNYRRQSWNILPRLNPAFLLPSDFDIFQILWRNTSMNTISCDLLKSTQVKSVTPHKQVFRSLKYKKSEYSETHQSFKRKYSQIDKDYTGRKLKRAVHSHQITSMLQAEILWNLGHSGQGVRVGVFDTGLDPNHPHFNPHKIKERTNWTNESSYIDSLGHGTFVAGVIASKSKQCPGFATDAELFIFRVFTNNQITYTSWFLDAFNYAIAKKIHIINLSIGGPDFMDKPFVDKVWELTANNVILVSAIGNDGPLYGTLNNPADQMDVLGVGGIDFDDNIAHFSSRGMTTWEIPFGYGRLKPDIVTYGANVQSSALRSGCRPLSGTSVASPVVAGAVALLYSAVLDRGSDINPASMKQALIAAAHRLNSAPMFEQGHGKLNLLKAYNILRSYQPQASLSPSYIDLTECPYMWPYCAQPLYHSTLPVIVNVTILNGMAVNGHIVEGPTWHPYSKHHGDHLSVTFRTSQDLWPWSGYLALFISVHKSAASWEGTAEGYVTLTVESPARVGSDKVLRTELKLPVKARIIPTPPSSQRILWDQFHNLRYPPGYFPRDNLKMKSDPLDWNGDHIHTNFKDLFMHLRKSNFYVEVLGTPFNCFNASNYGTLLIVDPEEEFFPDELTKLWNDIDQGLSVIIFAEWYNVSLIRNVRFYDENTKQMWTPDTGGANIPALNNLLSRYEIAFGDGVYSGNFKVGHQEVHYASGTSIIRFPSGLDSLLLYRDLQDEGQERLYNEVSTHSQVPILGLYQTKSQKKMSKAGRIALYGDSNCLDMAHMTKDCYWLMNSLLMYTMRNSLPSILKESLRSVKPDFGKRFNLPERIQGNRLYRYSNVLYQHLGTSQIRSLPPCPQYGSPSHIDPDNADSVPNNQYEPQPLLSLHLDQIPNLAARPQPAPPNMDDSDIMMIQQKQSFFSRWPTLGLPLALLATLSVLIILLRQLIRRNRSSISRKSRRTRFERVHHVYSVAGIESSLQ